jgi:hypothetical protein
VPSPRSVSVGDCSEQLSLIEVEASPGRRRRTRYVHVHTPEELAAFEHSKAIIAQIRGDGLSEDEKWCPGGCGKLMRRERRSCGRRWCDSVRPSWASSFRSVIHSALDAYCELYGSEAKVLQGVLTCTAEPWWWDTSKCAHPPHVPCSGPLGCRVLDSVAEEQRQLWSARRHETFNAARTAAIRQLRREGWEEEMPSLLLWVLEDQSRGVPHLHFVLGHTTALEKAFARTFFRELKSAAYAHGLGHTTTYEKAVLEQGKYEAGRLRNYVSKLAGYLAKGEGAAAFLLRHSGERVFYVAPWLSRISGVTMTIARLSRRVWAARKGLCDMPKMTAEQEVLVTLLLGPVVCAPNAP